MLVTFFEFENFNLPLWRIFFLHLKQVQVALIYKFYLYCLFENHLNMNRLKRMKREEVVRLNRAKSRCADIASASLKDQESIHKL